MTLRRVRTAFVWGAVWATMDPAVAAAQGRGGVVWTTSHADAQRTSSVRTDPKISKDSLSKPGFQFLWKQKLENQPRQLNALTQPVFSTGGYITYKGFKGLVYVGGASDSVYSLDYDLNKMFWTTRLSTASRAAGTAACPGGLTSITRDTMLAPAASGGGRAGGGGAALVPAAGPAGAAPAGAAVPDAAAAGGGRGRRGGGAGGAGAPPAGGGGGGGGGGGRGGAAAVYTVSSGGMLHVLNPQTGADMTPPIKMLPGANPKVVGSILVSSMLYVATADNCGGVPNGVYAMNLAPTPAAAPSGRATGPVAPDMKPASTTVVSWASNGGSVAGTAGVALGTDGTIYVATGDGEYSTSTYSDAVVALDQTSLKVKNWFTPGKSPFTSTPVVFQYKGKDMVVAANADGRLYLLNGDPLGSYDHRTPAHKTAQYTTGLADFTPGALSTFEDPDGTRWVLVASAGPIHGDTKYPVSNGGAANGAIAAFKLVEMNGVPTLEPAWVSRDMVAPVTPAIVNGVVFAIASGENVQVPATQRAQRSSNAVLYALDASTGKELWNSGTSIGSFVHGISPAADDSQVYVVGVDGTLYTFGFIVDR